MITPIGTADRRRAVVRGTVIDALVLAATIAVATLIGVTVFAQQADVVLRSGFAVGGVLVGLRMLSGLASLVFDADDMRSRRRSRRRAERIAAPELLEMEGRISLARVSAFDYQSRLRPVIHDLAAQRLLANRHIDLEREPDAARNVLGEELWNEVQSGSWISGDLRDAPAPSLATVRRLVDRLETI